MTTRKGKAGMALRVNADVGRGERPSTRNPMPSFAMDQDVELRDGRIGRVVAIRENEYRVAVAAEDGAAETDWHHARSLTEPGKPRLRARKDWKKRPEPERFDVGDPVIVVRTGEGRIVSVRETGKHPAYQVAYTDENGDEATAWWTGHMLKPASVKAE